MRMAWRLRARLESFAAAHVAPPVEAASDVPVAADARHQLAAAGGIGRDAADVDEVSAAGSPLVLAGQRGGPAGQKNIAAGG